MSQHSIATDRTIELDVRPILKAGGEPFSQIMSAIGNVPDDGALRLRATFKPTPLFRVLGQQGWSHEIESGDGDDWVILFYRDGASATKATPSSAELEAAHLHKEDPELAQRLKAEGSVWTLDVRQMSPPEPMELTLATLEKLPAGTSLVQVNERVPQFLLPLLEERGFRYSIVKNDGAEVRLEIVRTP